MVNFVPFPKLETKNLVLRRVDYDDINDLFEMRKDPEMNGYVDTKLEENPHETKAYIDKMNKGVDDNKWIIWAIEHEHSKKVIGTISIWNINMEEETGELGYGIVPHYQGQGLMKEALLTVVKYGFNVMKLKALDAYTEEHNFKSISLLEKCNFSEINRVDDEGYFSNRVYHMIVYRLEKIDLNNDMKYDIMYNENSEFNGTFYTAVKTTGVYCLPSCSAKKPNKVNVEFYNTFIESEAHGYRPCKICFPNLLHIKWNDCKQYIELDVPEDFSFEQCMVYLNRSDIECLHRIKDCDFYKLLKFEDINVVIKISMGSKKLKVTFMEHIPPKWVRAQVAKYIWDMFDLGTDLTSFYKLVENDSIIRLLIDKYKGLRIVKINDMFEAICWAIIGQQINLKFAYTLKKRLVECYGEKMIYDNELYFLFPTPKVISKLEVEDLKLLQFTTRKAEYIIGIAKLFQDGDIKKEKLVLEKDYEKLRKRLISIRGVGNWTADYTIMKCFDINNAFPIADVGIHNALKGILGIDRKPTIEEIEKLSVNWKGWQAYATFYLWRWLYD